MNQNFKIATVLGTRPEIIKLSTLIPVLGELCNHTIIYTSQHYDDCMAKVFTKELLRGVELEINPSQPKDTYSIEKYVASKLFEIKPDLVFVFGDTNSSLAGARAAKKAGVFLIHIEAGLRCFEPIREEFNRIEIDNLSDLLLCPTNLNKYFLQLEQIEEKKIRVVGSLLVEVYNKWVEKFIYPGVEDYVVLTLHREENVETPRIFTLLSEVCLIGEEIIFPAHPRTAKKLAVILPTNIELVKPMGYFQFGGLLRGAKVCLTDSGGVQEECFMAKVPCITLRRTTERQETVYLGANVLFDPVYGRNLGALVREMTEKTGCQAENPYGVGDTTSQIVEILEGLEL